MDEPTIPALTAPAPAKDNPLTRSKAGLCGMIFLALMLLACVATLPWTLSSAGSGDTPRYNAGTPKAGRLPPSWWAHDTDDAVRLNRLVDPEVVDEIAAGAGMSPVEALDVTDGAVGEALRAHWPTYLLGTDVIGRDLFVRLLTGGGISLAIGLSAAFISVLIGTVYGSVAAYAGGKVDALMMRIVDVLFGLPYILLVVLLAVASDAVIDEHISRSKARSNWQSARAAELSGGDVSQWLATTTQPADPALVDIALEALRKPWRRAGGAEPTRADAIALVTSNETNADALRAIGAIALPARQVSAGMRTFYDVLVLLLAIGGVSWLTMARVVRGQVLSLKAQPFMEAARAIGVPLHSQFLRHLLPNLMGPIIVYATLTVPTAILQESFLSFLGIGVKPPLPSWGNLAADGLSELNQYESHWWLLLFPCLLLGSTLLALNFVGEGLREAMDPKRRKRGA